VSQQLSAASSTLSPNGAPCLLQQADIAALVELTRKVAATSGAEGRPRFHPDPDAIDGAVVGPLLRDQIERLLDEPGWRRVWGFCRMANSLLRLNFVVLRPAQHSIERIWE